MRLHLIDATYELFRSYYGRPKRQAPDGREVGAVRGVVEGTLALLRQPDVTHVGAATDHVIRSFRNELFDGYKTEAGVPGDLLDQFPLAEVALQAIGVVVWPMTFYEADDALAAAAARFAGETEQVVILSPDKDMAQCVSEDRVVLHDRMRDIVYDEGAVAGKWGVLPESIPDYLALVGDSADGYPGLPGWGAKSTARVLARYGHLETIPLRAEQWDGVDVRGAGRLAMTLRERMGEALLYRYLALLRRDVPLEEDLDDLEWRGALEEPFGLMCDQLGWEELRRRPHRWQ